MMLPARWYRRGKKKLQPRSNCFRQQPTYSFFFCSMSLFSLWYTPTVYNTCRCCCCCVRRLALTTRSQRWITFTHLVRLAHIGPPSLAVCTPRFLVSWVSLVLSLCSVAQETATKSHPYQCRSWSGPFVLVRVRTRFPLVISSMRLPALRRFSNALHSPRSVDYRAKQEQQQKQQRIEAEENQSSKPRDVLFAQQRKCCTLKAIIKFSQWGPSTWSTNETRSASMCVCEFMVI